MRRLFLVTDEALLAIGLVERLRVSLNENGVIVEVFSEGEPEPSVRVAERCVAAAKPFGPDAVLGLGGGSNMDLAKLTATLLTFPGSPRRFFGEDQIPGPVVPIICVPTTAGSGSEVSAAAVVTDQESHVKVGILSNYLRPSAAVVDPLMTLSCPPKVTADSGIDALTHAIEAYTAVDNETFPLPPGLVGELTLVHDQGVVAVLLGGRRLATVSDPTLRAPTQAGLATHGDTASCDYDDVTVTTAP